jgi:phosphocarrier protein HPr
MNDAPSSPGGAAPVRCKVVICNQRGLHARAAARFVRVAFEFDAEISVATTAAPVSGRSIMGLMMLAAGPGTELEISATGPDAARAIAALAKLVGNGFDES